MCSALTILLGAAKDPPAFVTSTIDTLLPNLIPKDMSSEEYNSSFLSRHPSSPEHILGAARGLFEIKRASGAPSTDTVDGIRTIVDRLAEVGVPPSIPIMLGVVDLLRAAGAGDSVVDEYRGRCRSRLPLAWVFASDAEKAEQAKVGEKQALPNGKADL